MNSKRRATHSPDHNSNLILTGKRNRKQVVIPGSINSKDLDDRIRQLGVPQKELDQDDRKADRQQANDKGFRLGIRNANSGNLAKNIFAARHHNLTAGQNTQQRKATFAKWKEGREAQHLIPAELVNDRNKHKYPGLLGMIDSAENGMMLPGRKAGFSSSQNSSGKLQSKFNKHNSLNRPIHIDEGPKGNNRYHNQYNDAVSGVMDTIFQDTAKNKANYQNVMSAIRSAHKDGFNTGRFKQGGTAKKYVDEIKRGDILAHYNKANKTNYK